MSKSHEMDQLIEDLYQVPAGKIEPVVQSLRPTADKPQLSIAQSRQFGKARLRGYDLVVNSYNDPDGQFHDLGVLTQSLMIGRYGLAGESQGTQLTIYEAGERVGLDKNKAQWKINKALTHIGRRS